MQLVSSRKPHRPASWMILALDLLTYGDHSLARASDLTMDPIWLNVLLQNNEVNASTTHSNGSALSWPYSAPTSTSICIEIDLKGSRPPVYTPVPADPNRISKDPEPDTAHVFLCASSTAAQYIFNARKDSMSEAYVDSTRRCSSNFQSHVPNETLVPYDPRTMFRWLSIQPGQTFTLLLSDHVTLSDRTSVGSAVVHSQIRLSRGADNSYTAIWFDFRDYYALTSKSTEDFVGSTMQRRYLHHIGWSLGRSFACPTEFPAYLLLDILEIDLAALEPLALKEPSMQPVASLAPNFTESLANSVNGFELTQSITERAERLHTFINHMVEVKAIHLVAGVTAPACMEAVCLLQRSSAFITASLKRREEVAEKRLKLHDLVMQQKQASSTTVLTYCAALFLPLSLSGTFLSMQTRLKDLHLIAFDFLGVTLVFCTMVMFAYVVSRAILTAKLVKWAQQLGRRAPQRSRWTFALPVWVIVMGSFVSGMFTSVRLCFIALGMSLAILLAANMACFALVRLIRILRTKNNQ
jgi:hypothetical protein